MLNRLPIALVQLEAGHNSNKLKNEIRQLLYSLYRSKNMTKQVYNNLMNYILIKKKKKTTISENDNVNENENDNNSENNHENVK